MSGVTSRVVAAVALPVGAAVVAVLATLVPAVLPVLLVLGLAALVRLGETLLDRVMVALALSTGVLAAFGLLFSVWPWGLDPRAVGVLAWAGLWLLAVCTRRRPRLPRPGAADLAFPVALLGALVPAWRILRADGYLGRLSVLMIGEDNARHLTWFESIRDTGSYIFLAGDDVFDTVIRGSEFYPQGWHLSAATLDHFVGVSRGASTVDHYLVWVLLTHAYLVLTVVWLALTTRRRAGAMHVVAVAAVGGCLVTGSELFRPLVSGYPAESLALSLAVSAAAVVVLGARASEAAAPREAMLVLAAILVAVSFAYYVFLVPMGLFVVAWLWQRRRVALRAPVVLASAVLVAAPLGAVMPWLGVTKAVGSGALETAGNSGPVLLALAVLAGAAIAGAMASGAWRETGWRWIAVAAGPFLVFGGALSVVFESGYYVHKIWHVPIALAAALCAALVLRFPSQEGRAGRLRTGSVLAAVTAATVVGTGITPWGPGVFTDKQVGTTNLGVWRNDFWAQTGPASSVLRAMGQGRPADGVTSFVVDVDPYVGYRTDVFLAALQGNSGTLVDVHYVNTFTQPDRLREQLEAAPGRVRLLATSPDAALFAKGIVDQDPDPTRVRILTLPPLEGD